MPSASGRLISAIACVLLVRQVPGRRVRLTPAMAPAARLDGPLSALEASMDKLNATISQIINGKAALGKVTFGRMNVRKCTTLCPELWGAASWYVASMKKAALDIVTATVGTRPSLDIEDLRAVHPRAAIRYKETMRTTVHTFLEAVDTSPFQRVFLILVSSPFFIRRKVAGLTQTGFCFFKEAWEEMKAKGTKPWATGFWSVLFAGCPPMGQPLPEPFENGKKAEQLASSLALAFAGETPEILERQRQLFESAPQYVGCVLKPSRKAGRWSRWELTVKEGQLTWRRSKSCGSPVLKRTFDAGTRTTSMAYLSAKEGEDAVQFVETDAPPGKLGGGRDLKRCIKLSNPWRNFIFCTDDGTSMELAKNAIEGQLKVIGQETRGAIATSVQLQRLIFNNGDKELKEELADVEKIGQDLEEKPEHELLTSEEEDSDEEVTAKDLQQITEELGSFADDLNAASQHTQVGTSEDQDVASRVIQTVISGRLPAPNASSLLQDTSARAAGRASVRGQFVGIVYAAVSAGSTLTMILNILMNCQGQNCVGEE